MDETSLKHFDSEYSIIASYNLVDAAVKQCTGDRNNRICRYCNRSAPAVKFSLEAHAFPEFTGNRSLIAYDECDECNELFSRLVEDDFAKYIGPLRTISQILGKQGVPTYKSPDKRSRIGLEEAGVHITTQESAPITTFDCKNQTLKIQMTRQPYVPMGAFKCLVKMAIAACPNTELPALTHLAAWIRNPRHTYESFPYKPLMVMEQFTPGPMPYRGVHAILFKRKNNAAMLPYLQFATAFGNSTFQIVLPMPTQDEHWLGQQIKFYYIPLPFDENYPYGETRRCQRDFTSPDVCKNQEFTVHMHFDEARQTLGTFFDWRRLCFLYICVKNGVVKRLSPK